MARLVAQLREQQAEAAKLDAAIAANLKELGYLDQVATLPAHQTKEPLA